MDEFWSRKMMRRLALLAVINSVAIPAVATQPLEKGNGSSPAQQQEAVQQSETVEQPGDSLRSLLSQGWQLDGRAPATMPLGAVADEVASKAQPPQATVVRPRCEPLEVAEQAEEDAALKQLDDPKSSTLAELLRTAPDVKSPPTEPAAKPLEADTAEVKLADQADPTAEQPNSDEEPAQATIGQEDEEAKASSFADLLNNAPVFDTETSKPNPSSERPSIASKNSLIKQKGLVEQSLEVPALSERHSELLRTR